MKQVLVYILVIFMVLSLLGTSVFFWFDEQPPVENTPIIVNETGSITPIFPPENQTEGIQTGEIDEVNTGAIVTGATDTQDTL